MRYADCKDFISFNNRRTEKINKKIEIKNYKSIQKVAIRLNYNGKNISGLAPQKNIPTVAGYIISALLYSNLVEEDWTYDINYAGRTDKGVSARGMIISLNIKSREEKEYPYDAILNSYLPAEIRITGWAYVSPTFSARFSCKERIYKYYFLKENLDIQKMKECLFKFLELEDFKNFCKKEKYKEDDFYLRKLNDLQIVEDGIMCMVIRGRSFLHNMVRRIFWVIEKIGSGEMKIEEIDEIASGTKEGGTAKAENLLFYEAVYEPELNFVGGIKKDGYENWKEKTIECSIIRNFIDL